MKRDNTEINIACRACKLIILERFMNEMPSPTRCLVFCVQ